MQLAAATEIERSRRLISKVQSGVSHCPSVCRTPSACADRKAIAALQLGVCKLGSHLGVAEEIIVDAASPEAGPAYLHGVDVDELGFHERRERLGNVEVRKQVGGIAVEPGHQLAGFRARGKPAGIARRALTIDVPNGLRSSVRHSLHEIPVGVES